MCRLLQATKPQVLVLVLMWLAAACGSPTGPIQTPTETAPSAIPSPVPQETASSNPAGAGLTALLSQVRGEVTVVETSGAGEQTTRPARPMQVLVAGATIRVGAGAQAGLICSTERWIDLAGPSGWQLTEAACTEGRDLPAGTFRSMAPKAGRILTLDGSDVIELKVVEAKTKEKEGDYGRIPVILSPRNTSLLELTPELRWVEVDGAIEYVLSLVGMKGFEELIVDASELTCVSDPLAAPNRICSLPWPASEWPLELGQRYFLTVAARTGVAADLRPSEKSTLRALAGDAASEVGAAVARVQVLNLDAFTQDLWLASLYREHGLYGDAIDAYERVLGVQPAAVIYVALGDTYSLVALYRWAFEAYCSALDLLSEGEDDLAVRAAAEFGIGRVYYNYADNFAEAAKHLEAAVRLYEEAGATEWQEAAQRALEEAERRLSP
jgi:hypothetical protein